MRCVKWLLGGTELKQLVLGDLRDIPTGVSENERNHRLMSKMSGRDYESILDLPTNSDELLGLYDEFLDQLEAGGDYEEAAEGWIIKPPAGAPNIEVRQPIVRDTTSQGEGYRVIRGILGRLCTRDGVRLTPRDVDKIPLGVAILIRRLAFPELSTFRH